MDELWDRRFHNIPKDVWKFLCVTVSTYIFLVKGFRPLIRSPRESMTLPEMFRATCLWHAWVDARNSGKYLQNKMSWITSSPTLTPSLSSPATSPSNLDTGIIQIYQNLSYQVYLVCKQTKWYSEYYKWLSFLDYMIASNQKTKG